MLEGFYYKNGLLICFFLQGMIFSYLLLRQGLHHGYKANKWLSLFMFLSCMYVTPWMLGHSGWYTRDGYREFLFFVPFQQLLLIGPVIYMYTQSLLDADFTLARKDYLHFLPAFLYLAYSLFTFIADQFILPEYYFYADGRDKDLLPWYQTCGLISMMIYTAASIRLYSQYKKRIYDELSYADTVVYRWIRKFLIIFMIILLLRVVFLVLYPDWGFFGIKWWYYFFYSCLAYYIALEGFMHGIRVINSYPLSSVDNLMQASTQTQPSSPIQLSLASPRLPMEDKQIQLWKSSLLKLMEEDHLYQNPSLTLTEVADQLQITSKQVSTVINQGFEMNFNDFVNQFRVGAVKQRLALAEHHQYTILGIALACGFNSKTTFNRVFKKNTSLTPRQYLAQLKKEEEDDNR